MIGIKNFCLKKFILTLPASIIYHPAYYPAAIFIGAKYWMETRELYNRLKNSAKKRGIQFSLTLVDLNNLTFPISCPILGIPLKHNRGRAKDDSYSIDRIDSSKGYEIDNIIVVSWRANRLKNNATTEELELISRFYKGEL